MQNTTCLHSRAKPSVLPPRATNIPDIPNPDENVFLRSQSPRHANPTMLQYVSDSTGSLTLNDLAKYCSCRSPSLSTISLDHVHLVEPKENKAKKNNPKKRKPNTTQCNAVPNQAKPNRTKQHVSHPQRHLDSQINLVVSHTHPVPFPFPFRKLNTSLLIQQQLKNEKHRPPLSSPFISPDIHPPNPKIIIIPTRSIALHYHHHPPQSAPKSPVSAERIGR